MGIFVLVSLIVFGVVVFLIGDERNMFAQHQELKAAFKDVKGLTRGSPVRMGGVDIGAVANLGYGKNAADDTIYVTMKVVKTEAARIKTDSVAEVSDKGLLGDKMIVITVGSDEAAALGEGEMIPTKETKDIEQIIGDLKTTLAGAERVMGHLEQTTKSLADESFHGDIKKTVTELSLIAESVNNGEGYIGRLLRDKTEADRIAATIDQFKKSAEELRGLLSSTRQVVERVRTGPGFAHGVIYDEAGTKALSQIGGAAEEVGVALRDVRQGESLAHEVLYGKDSGEMVANLNKASADLRVIVEDMRQGKGTLGAFLTDPSVYEDMKVLLGNVGRNRSLRALVRYSIKQDEENNRVVETKGGESGPSPSAGTAAGASASTSP